MRALWWWWWCDALRLVTLVGVGMCGVSISVPPRSCAHLCSSLGDRVVVTVRRRFAGGGARVVATVTGGVGVAGTVALAGLRGRLVWSC
jgi:hypothetical protein